MIKTRCPRVVPKFDDARDSSRALVDDKESKTAADQRTRNKQTCGWQDTKIQLLTKRHNLVLAQFKVEKACKYGNIKWLYM